MLRFYGSRQYQSASIPGTNKALTKFVMLHRFTACRGKGAWLNETTPLPLIRSPIPAMPESAPKGCVFSCEVGLHASSTLDITRS